MTMCHHQLTLWNADIVVCQIIKTTAPQHAPDLYFCFQFDSQRCVLGDFCIWSSNSVNSLVKILASEAMLPGSANLSVFRTLLLILSADKYRKSEICKLVHIILKPQNQKEPLYDHLIWNLPTSAPPGRNPLPSSCSNGFSDKRSTTSSTRAASSAQWAPQ